MFAEKSGNKNDAGQMNEFENEIDKARMTRFLEFTKERSTSGSAPASF